MANPHRRPNRSIKRLFRKISKRLPEWHWAGRVTDRNVRRIGCDDELLYQAVVANVNQNGLSLCNMVHSHRLLNLMAQSVGQDFRHRTILEIGSSACPTLPLILLLSGAERVFSNNLLPLEQTVPEASVRLIGLLRSALHEPSRPLAELVIWEATDRGRVARLKPEVFEAWGELVAEALPLPSESVDVVFSLAVLEHVKQPDAVLARSYELLRPGGWCYHAIDLRDHRDFSRPVDFLTLTEEEYLQAAGGGNENRLRASQYLERFEKAGFELVSARWRDRPLPEPMYGRPDLVDLAEISLEEFYPRASLQDVEPWVTEAMRAGFAPPYCNLSLQDLSAICLLVIARKP